MSRLPLSTEEVVACSISLERPVRTVSEVIWLGEVVFATVSKGVENICNTLQKVMRRWTTDLIVRSVLGLMVIVNPRLNSNQQTHLTPILARAVNQFVWQRSLDLRVMRGIVALACPNQDTALLFGYLMEVIAGLAHHPCQEDDIMDQTTASDLESPSASSVDSYVEEAKVAHTLTQFYCVEPIYVAAMPCVVKKAVLGALNGGLDVAANNPSGLLVSNQQSPPICCITLEPLLCPDGSVTSDVVAVVQKSQTIGKDHAFLYRGRALRDWHAHSTVPTNPDTRTLVKPTEVFRLS
ncbi:hypothetical protein Mapa_012469 [Marchantia paleacea]|nr:hypothetical protein Mapa_012469 [Marchantia paleacea]